MQTPHISNTVHTKRNKARQTECLLWSQCTFPTPPASVSCVPPASFCVSTHSKSSLDLPAASLPCPAHSSVGSITCPSLSCSTYKWDDSGWGSGWGLLEGVMEAGLVGTGKEGPSGLASGKCPQTLTVLGGFSHCSSQDQLPSPL